MNTAIKVEGVSKLYRLGEVNSSTVIQDLNRWWASMRGKEDPYSIIGTRNDRTAKSSSIDYAWALKDINFEIAQGEVVGVIGRNGAGKSTLLKLLSRVTLPTSGTIKAKGRIASLLEVGTGFHPELTGRENVFLNGAILGMTKKEIKSRFDQIVAFSGVERYIDTPVKRYSSGMYVRLAFAVAAHLQSEILIVDEVLAVGDQEFQDKCLGKMNDVAKNEGRTVLFVSHNMGSIVQLCSSAFLMSNGQLIKQGPTSDIVELYIAGSGQEQYTRTSDEYADYYFEKIFLSNIHGNEKNDFLHDEQIQLNFKVKMNVVPKSLQIGIALLDKYKRKVFTSHHKIDTGNVKNNLLELSCKLPKSLITPGKYSFDAALFLENITVHEYRSDICKLHITDNGSLMSNNSSDYGCVFVDCIWKQ